MALSPYGLAFSSDEETNQHLMFQTVTFRVAGIGQTITMTLSGGVKYAVER